MLYELPISFSQAAMGDKVEIPTLTGKVRLTIPESTQSGRVFRLRGTSGSLNAATNPILVEDAPPRRVFWGDVHAHGWGDSTMHLMHLRSDRLDPAARHADPGATPPNLQQRALEPEEIAPMAVLLASPAGGGITGQVISVDGGYRV